MPITSMPGLYGNSGRTIMLPPVMRSRSFRFSGIACTRTRTSPASGLGIGTSSSTSAVRGGPYSCVRHARIVWSLSTSLTLPQPAARSHLTTVGASLALPAVCLAASTLGPAHGLWQRLGLTVGDAWIVVTALGVAGILRSRDALRRGRP